MIMLGLSVYVFYLQVHMRQSSKKLNIWTGGLCANKCSKGGKSQWTDAERLVIAR